MILDSIQTELEPIMTFGDTTGKNTSLETNSLDLDDSFDSRGVSQTIERWKETRLKKLDEFGSDLDSM